MVALEAVPIQEAPIRIEAILRHVGQLVLTKIDLTALVEVLGQLLDTIVHLEPINITGVLHLDLTPIEVVQQEPQYLEVLPTEALEVVLKVAALTEAQAVALEVRAAMQEVQLQGAVIIALEVEALEVEVVEVIEVLVVVLEVRAAVQEVLVALQDHHQVVDLQAAPEVVVIKNI